MSLTSMLLTGSPDGLTKVKKINRDIEKIPYENFPFCCNCKKRKEDNSCEREINFQ